MKKLADIVNIGYSPDDYPVDDRDPWIAFCQDLHIPQCFYSVCLEKLQGCNEIIKENLRNWITGNEQNLIFYGGVGCGKTHTALTMLKFMQSRRPWIQYLTSSKMLEFGKEKGEYHLRSVYGECDILVIDDLGLEKPAEWEIKYFYAIADERYSNKKRTIITTNLNQHDLELIYTKRVTSRLCAQWCKFDDVDWREMI